MFRLMLIAIGVSLLGVTSLPAQAKPPADPSSPKVTLNEAEQAFVDRMTNAALVGRFSVEGREDREPKAERYAISGVTKVGEDRWIITARITYGEVDIPVPVPVQIFWADDTPVISLTDLSIPGLGAGFTTRVLFYESRYAGTWYHGRVGGHMWGTIEKAEEASEPDSTNPSNE